MHSCGGSSGLRDEVDHANLKFSLNTTTKARSELLLAACYTPLGTTLALSGTSLSSKRPAMRSLSNSTPYLIEL